MFCDFVGNLRVGPCEVTAYQRSMWHCYVVHNIGWAKSHPMLQVVHLYWFFLGQDLKMKWIINLWIGFSQMVTAYPPDNLSIAYFVPVGLMAPKWISTAIPRPIKINTTTAIHNRLFSLFPFFELTSSCESVQ